ncbi:MAG: LytTR family DNA-binding domain-containing protein [Dysgonamonadaceae bacterium]|jgi:two-component system LytT family response regulator|nr:LytTR family DNA-binding domain-containing protein [Dysgonamonadaceae bacterium]
MKAIIIEDELIATQNLVRLIEVVSPEIEIIATLQSVEESVEWFLENSSPDLAFMDIHLADGASFSIFDKVEVKCPIIFTTAYDEYALKAFEVNSIDYLLKPITKTDLERAISKYKNIASNKTDNSTLITNIIAAFNEQKNVYKSHFLIPYKDKLLPLPTKEIAFVFSENKMAKIVTFSQKTYHLDSSLDEIISQLSPVNFFRANRQYIVNHDAIKDIAFWFGNKLSVNLTINIPEKMIVSKEKVPKFKKWYAQ